MILYHKIILIEDESLCNLITTKILTKASIAHTIESFLDATTALREIKAAEPAGKQTLPNLILLDINMPQMNGWEFLEAFETLPASLLNHYKVMMLSSSMDPRDIAKSETYASVSKFISKPFSLDKLLS
ncbi:MAG: response regulator [Chitinophagaceae bacterium]|jgi:CheY-like chemotaxis protein